MQVRARVPNLDGKCLSAALTHHTLLERSVLLLQTLQLLDAPAHEEQCCYGYAATLARSLLLAQICAPLDAVHIDGICPFEVPL